MEGDNFCTACGRELPPDAAFCPECGAAIGGGAQKGVYEGPYGYQMPKRGPSFAMIILIYGLFATILGVLDLFSALTLTEELYTETMEMMAAIAGIDPSTMPPWDDSLPLKMGIAYASLTVSGVAAILCYIQCKKAEDWRRAMILCAISSVVVLGMAAESGGIVLGGILCVIGLLFTYMIYNNRNTFNS